MNYFDPYTARGSGRYADPVFDIGKTDLYPDEADPDSSHLVEHWVKDYPLGAISPYVSVRGSITPPSKGDTGTTTTKTGTTGTGTTGTGTTGTGTTGTGTTGTIAKSTPGLSPTIKTAITQFFTTKVGTTGGTTSSRMTLSPSGTTQAATSATQQTQIKDDIFDQSEQTDETFNNENQLPGDYIIENGTYKPGEVVTSEFESKTEPQQSMFQLKFFGIIGGVVLLTVLILNKLNKK